MSALSDHQLRRRRQRIAQAKSIIVLARAHVSTRPAATGSDLIRTLTESVVGLIEELSIIGDLKHNDETVGIDTGSPRANR